MTRFASSLSRHPVASHAVGETAGAVMEALGAEDPDLVVCFASPHFAGAFDDMTHALRNLLDPRVMVGVTVVAVVGVGQEVEDGPAFSMFAACLPDARLVPARLEVEQTPDGDAIVGWPELDDGPSSLILLADPFSFPVEGLLRRLNEDRPGLPVIGGMASAARGPGGNRLVLDDEVTDRGAVGVFVEGAGLHAVVSQGCRPIGNPYVVTESDRNLVSQLAGRPALERLRELAADVSDEDRELLQQGLHVGVVVDEQRDEFRRGDFLVRNVIGADRATGAIAIGERVPVGRTLQFHVRDAAAADEDLRALLDGERAEAALLFTCNGRGQRLFGTPDHDAAVLAELLGPVPAAGGFCAGEIGPIGGQSFLHGFTASVALFT
ncbi:MAG: FIST N-terminal domain-containing protein [Acidimicrobiia bacterium]